VEVSILFTGGDSQFLSRLHLYSHVPSGNLESIEHSEVIGAGVGILRDRYRFEFAGGRRIKGAFTFDDWMVNRPDCAGPVELVRVHHGYIWVLEIARVRHQVVCNLRNKWRALSASWIIWVDQITGVAWLLKLIVTLHDHSFNKWLHEVFGIIQLLVENCRLLLLHSNGNQLHDLVQFTPWRFFANEIILLDVDRLFHTEVGKRCMIDSIDHQVVELVLLDWIDVDAGVVERLSESGDPVQTVHFSSKYHDWRGVWTHVNERRPVFLNCDQVSLNGGSEQDTAHDVPVLEGTFLVLVHEVLNSMASPGVSNQQDLLLC